MCGGEWDIPLNSEGEIQALRAAQKVWELRGSIAHMYVSPMKRAQQTASILNSMAKLSSDTIEGLREWRVGEWDQKPWEDVPNPFNTTIDPPGGESRVEFETRVETTLIEIFSRSPETPLIVSHGAVAHALFTILGIDRALIDNCVLYCVRPQGLHWVLLEC